MIDIDAWRRSTDAQTERALLGGLMRAPQRLHEAEGLQVAWTRPEHRALHDLLVEMVELGEPVDEVTVPMRVARDGAERYGGVSYVVGMTSLCPSVAAIPHYAAEVREMHLRRLALSRLDAAAEEIIADGARGVERVGRDLIDLAESVDAIESTVPVSSEVESEVDAILEGGSPRMSTGLRDLDEILGGGLEGGRLYIVAGRPAMGKSSVAETIELHAALEGRVVTASVLEGGKRLRYARLVSRLSGVWGDRIRRRNLDQWHIDAIQRARQTLEQAAQSWYWRCAGGQGVEDVERLALEARRRHGRVDLVVVDYLQLLRLEPGERRHEGLSRAANHLAALAIELDCPILALAQLNRQPEQRKNKRPQLADLAEAGGLEQAADTVIGLYRAEYYLREACPPEQEGLIEAIVLKQRSGRTGTVKLRWEGRTTRVSDYDEPQVSSHDYDRGPY